MEKITLLIIGCLFVYIGYNLNKNKADNQERAKGINQAFWMKLSGFLFSMGISMLAFFVVRIIEPIDFSIIVVSGNDIRFKDIFMVWTYAYFFVAMAGLFFNINTTKGVLDFHKKHFF